MPKNKTKSMQLDSKSLQQNLDDAMKLKPDVNAIPDLGILGKKIEELYNLCKTELGSHDSTIEDLENEKEEIEDKIRDLISMQDPENLSDIYELTKMCEDIEKEKAELLKKTGNHKKRKRSEIEKDITRQYLMDVPKNMIDLMLDDKRDENLEKIKKMFDMLRTVQTGKVNIETAQQLFNEKLNNEYVYPKFGSKEEFEKAMAKGAKIDAQINK